LANKSILLEALKKIWCHLVLIMKLHRPTKKELIAAAGRTVPDVSAQGLKVLFCGINPGLYSAAVGHHFARPGNRFWPALHLAGFTDRLFDPSEERKLLTLGYGITNIVARASASAKELSADELEEGGRRLIAKVGRIAPRFLAVLGITAYRQTFHCPSADIGLQENQIRKMAIWVLPNPSGLNASYQIKDLVNHFRKLRNALDG
jgi:double-stranded uracil-DNA glycosylase